MNLDTSIIVILFLGLTIACLVVFLIVREKRSRQEIDLARTMADYEKIHAGDLQSRLNALFQLNRGFVQADDEHTIIDLVLTEAMKVTGAVGASFVPLDDRGQPRGTISQGDFPFSLPDAWLEYLASPAIRQQCNSCKNYGTIMKICPLLKGPFSTILGLYCLPLSSGEQELGVLNLYLPGDHKMGTETQEFLRSIIDETTLALKGLRMRRSELTAISELHTLRQKSDMRDILHEMQINLQNAVFADYVYLAIRGYGFDWTGNSTILPDQMLTVGKELETGTENVISATMQQIFTSSEDFKTCKLPITNEGIKSEVWYIAEVLKDNNQRSIGIVLAGKSDNQPFDENQHLIFQAIASQIGLVIENTQGTIALQYKSTIEERGRIAREIHDGLAQTLGFLKLQTAQMQSLLNKGDLERLNHILKVSYSVLAEAYQDAREAIDGLRVSGIRDNGVTHLCLDEAIHQVVREYQENDMLPSIKINLISHEDKTDLPPEVAAQFIRILQEALSNVRKHSGADQVWITTRIGGQDMILEIHDNGNGFDAEDVPEISRHGLKGMRERADLIGADFQVISRPGAGTTVSIRYPYLARNKLEM